MTRLVVDSVPACSDVLQTRPSRTVAPPPREALRVRPLNVTVLDDCDLVAHGLARMLAPFSARVRVLAPDPRRGPRAQDEDASPSPDIVLFDCYAAGVRDGILRARTAPVTPPGTKVVAYTWQARPDLVADALRHGFCGYIGKSLSGQELVEALEVIARDGPVVSPARGACAPSATDVDWTGDDAGLTPREVDVLTLIATGCTNAEIAQTLHVSINSVKSYVRSAYRKIGVTSRSQAVLWGVAHGRDVPERFRPVSPPRRVS